MKKFKKSHLLAEIKEQYGTITNLKKELKKGAKNNYGTMLNTVDISGCKIIYTDNPNCFASFVVQIGLTGMCTELALNKTSLTKRGKRVAPKSFLF